MKSKISIIESRDIKDYRLVLEGLVDDWGYIYWDAILKWCDIISDTKDGKFWQVWVIKYNDKNVGICGLFSHKKNNIKELWLGWFGLHPKYRNKKIGSQVLTCMEHYAIKMGCKTILSYVDKDGKPLPFYYRHGYKNIGTVKQYLKLNPKISSDEFEDLEDHVISKKLE